MKAAGHVFWSILAVGVCAQLGASLHGQSRQSALSSGEWTVSLQTNAVEDGEEEIRFATRPGLVYRIEQCLDTHKDIWGVVERIVADDEEGDFTYKKESKRYRVIQEDDRIQFPDWRDLIEQYLYFDVWTPVKGTYRLDLYGDGKLLHSASKAIPTDGHFGVYDAGYNPVDWPNAGYYSVNEWRLWVTITPNAPGGDGADPITTSVKKIGGRNPRVALTRKPIFEDKPFKRAAPPSKGPAFQ